MEDSYVFNQIFIKLADKEDRHKISDKLDFGPVSTIGMRVTFPFLGLHRL